MRVVRRDPRPVVGGLITVLAVVAVWAWWSRRNDARDTTVTDPGRVA